MQIIKYKQQLDYLISHDTIIINNGVYVAGYSIQETLDSLTLISLFVDKNYRGKGIGNKLVKSAIKDAKKIGSKSLFLMVKKDNKKAIKMYKKNKFKFDTNDSDTRYIWLKLKIKIKKL